MSNVYTGINLMLPTYGRSKTRLPEFISSVEDTCDKDNVFYSFMVNHTDTDTIEYLKGRGRTFIAYESERTPHLAKFWNRLYRETPFNDPGIMVCMVGDDMVFQTDMWDEILLDACNEKRGLGYWFGDDCKNTHQSLMVNFFTTRLVIDAQSPHPFMCEAFPCDDMDWVHDHVARRLGIRYYLPHLKIFHNHATFEKKNEDNTYHRLRAVFHITQEARKEMPRYVGERLDAIRKNIPSLIPSARVLFVCMGRYGDIIHASLHANRLIKMGYKVDWLTICYYKDLVESVCPECSIILDDRADPVDGWGDPRIKDVENKYQGYDFYVGAQPGATELHDFWVGRKGMVRFLIDTVSERMIESYWRNGLDVIPERNIFKIEPGELKKYAKIVNLPKVESKQPLCIIAPEIISTTAIWPEGGVEELVKKYSRKYDVMVLTKSLGYTFMECVSLIKQCALFIGQDSGLAWAAIYSSCRKIVYHTKKRIAETNMMFSAIDKSYEDVIL